MIGLLQRVTRADVSVDGECIGRIGPGLLVLVCAQREDGDVAPGRLLDKLLALRVFADADGKMNRPLRDIDGAGTPGGLLLVPQFTLAADTRSGTRPGFSAAAPPERGRLLFDALVARARAAHPVVGTGRFGADMQVSLVNDGPVTFWLETK